MTVVRAEQPEQQADGGGLPGAVRSEETNDLARLDRERDIGDRRTPTETLREPDGLDHCATGAGGVGVGGVLEPLQASPVIIEDGAFIGSRCIVTEGVRIGAGAVLAPNVSLTASVPIIDVTGSEPVEHRGAVPPRSVVLPGTRPKAYPAGTFEVACALIVGQRSASTDLKTSLTEVLREFEIAS